MKKFNKNIITFIFCMIFTFVGLLSTNFYSELIPAIDDFVSGTEEISYRLIKFREKFEHACEKGLLYNDSLVDINSLKENFLGTRVILKDDGDVVKSDSGSLIQPEPQIKKSDIDKIVHEINKLKTVSENNGAKFLYCMAPSKELYEVAPPNIENHGYENRKKFLSSLSESKIPCVDLSKALKEYGVKDSEIFYYTDHHWTARSGFTANKIICEELNKRYGFEYIPQYTDINNYNIVNYPDWFLGSKGKKAGLFFSGKGADDFELITPKFKTDLIEEQPFKGQIRKGNFENTIIYKENLEKNYHHTSLYATYGGGDFRLQIIKNNLNPDGKKILIIRDSFASVVTPFLSQQTSELHICDLRDFSGMIGDKINVEEYIKDTKPDYVLILYTGITNSDFFHDKFNFF